MEGNEWGEGVGERGSWGMSGGEGVGERGSRGMSGGWGREGGGNELRRSRKNSCHFLQQSWK